MANRKLKSNGTTSISEAIDSITDRFDRSIATANLLSVLRGDAGLELEDQTISEAAFYLYRDLQQLKADVGRVMDAALKDSQS